MTTMEPRIEVIFLGTGTSSSLPHLDCLTAPPNRPRCETCLSTLTPEGKKNIRRNTGAVLRITNASGRETTVVCDVGKNFQAAAIEWFPKYKLRHIDAVVITHAHADAMNGLDDLRGWTLRGAIQPFIDVHVSQATFLEVQRAFPYLVSKEFASGGGDVPEFKWHIFEDMIPFEIRDTGIHITPFPVHHGRIFSTPPPVHVTPASGLPTPEYTAPSTPTSDRSLPLPPTIHLANDNFAKNDTTSKPQPFISYGFKFLDSVVYISDVSFIPEDSWQVILPIRQDGTKRIPVFVIDCLRLNKHISHFGLREAVDAARRLNAQRTYLTGFGHEVSHDEYVSILEFAQNKQTTIGTQSRSNICEGIKLIGDTPAPWSRPAFDGLKVVIDSSGIRDDYDYC